MNLAVTVLRVVMALVLIVAGALKAGHVPALAASLAGYRLLPAEIIVPLSFLIPWFEIVVGAYILIGLFTRTASVIAAIAYVLYAGAIASAVVRGIPANCGCFGPGDVAKADWPHVLLDLVLAALCVLVARYGPGVAALDKKLRLT